MGSPLETGVGCYKPIPMHRQLQTLPLALGSTLTASIPMNYSEGSNSQMLLAPFPYPTLDDIQFIEIANLQPDFDSLCIDIQQPRDSIWFLSALVRQNSQYCWCTKLKLKGSIVHGTRVEYCGEEFEEVVFSRDSLVDYFFVRSGRIVGGEVLRQFPKESLPPHRQLDESYILDTSCLTTETWNLADAI